MIRRNSKMGLPNILSIFRIALVPVFMYIYLSGIPGYKVISGAVFLLAAITDILDGYIARKYDKITKLGKVLDPLADKLLQCSALLCLWLSGTLPLWPLVIFVVKELAMLLGGLAMLGKLKDVFAANVFGKIATFVMSVSIFSMIIFNIPPTIATYIIIGAFAILLLALASYAIPFFRTMATKNPGDNMKASDCSDDNSENK